MTAARFFERAYAAVGRHAALDRIALEEKLASTTVGITCGELSGNFQSIAQLVINMLARLYPRLRIDGPSKVVEPLSVLAKSINPQIELVDVAPTISIAVNAGNIDGGLAPYADGWVAGLQNDQTVGETGAFNPYSAAAAACFAVSAVFRSTFLGARVTRPVVVSLLDFSADHGRGETLDECDLGDCALIGLGAVGNSALLCLAADATVKGTFQLVDAEQIELSNLQRYVLAKDEDVAASKTDIARRALDGSRIRAEPRPGVLEEIDGGLPPTFLISVDSVATRRHAQALLPRLVVNGWTSESGLGASWHRLSDDAACLACLYQPSGVAPSQTDLAAQALGIDPAKATQLWLSQSGITEPELAEIANGLKISPEKLNPWIGRPIQALYTEVICGMVGVDVRGQGQLEAVPLAHQSVFAGVLASAELRKRLDRRVAGRAQKERLIAWHDVLREPPTHWLQARTRVPGCICGDSDYQDVFRQKWNITS